jgi:PAS domain S-box-containing protein
MHNKLLQRQIQKYIDRLDDLPEKYMPLFKVVSESYDHYEKDRKMLERAIELSSSEMIELNNSLRKETEELKKADYERRKSEANLRAIFNNTDTAYVLLDDKATILSFNPIAREMSLETLANPIEEGINYIDLMGEERKPEVTNSIKNVLREGRQLSYETCYKLNSKANKWLHVRMHPVFGVNKKVVGLSIATTNITDRKNAEQKIRESNERYEMVTKATSDIIWDWDIINDKMYRSAAYSQVFGYIISENNDYRDSWLKRIHPEDRAKIQNSLKNLLNQDDLVLWENEYRYLRNNGETAYVLDRAYIIQDDNKKPVRMVGAMRDITTEKLLEIERYRITTDLIQRNKDLEQFAYIVSHNLRAPVANIIGFADNLSDDFLDEKLKKKMAEQLSVSANKLDAVIKDLNHVLQIRQQINEKKGNVNFTKIVDDIRLSVSNIINNEQVTLITDFSSADNFFTIKSYFYSIFQNLIVNSIKYKKTGMAPVITISSAISQEGLLIKFKDNGSGMDLKKINGQLFGLYKRFHPHIEGKGMGLFMVKTQVEALGGKISITSEVQKGTEFIIQFPL